MLKRKINDFLLTWSKTKHEECLLIKGARQVGKTYAVRHFGKHYYKCYIEINFIENPQFKTIFSNNVTSNEILKQISLLMPNLKFAPNETLLFLDEIQECPEARTALKFLAQENEIDVVASGSLLGISYKNSKLASIPVGYEKQIVLHPLDLEEFLWAIGYSEGKISALREYFDSMKKIPNSIHEAMLHLTREYMAIGGMPAVVEKYIHTQNFSEVYGVQKSLLNSYLDDIAKYADTTTRTKARECYGSIPKQLAKENSKFKYSVVEKAGTARKFKTAVDWLEEAELIYRCNCVSSTKFPLAAYIQNNRFKIYMNDMGLLTAMYGFNMMSAVVNDTLAGPMKGGYYENFMACMIANANMPLYYWANKSSTEEIEFLLDAEGLIEPVEVKAKRGATATLNKLLASDNIKCGYKFGSINVGHVDKKISLPLYMAMFLFPCSY